LVQLSCVKSHCNGAASTVGDLRWLCGDVLAELARCPCGE
jgi:hypothetical protein